MIIPKHRFKKAYDKLIKTTKNKTDIIEHINKHFTNSIISHNSNDKFMLTTEYGEVMSYMFECFPSGAIYVNLYDNNNNFNVQLELPEFLFRYFNETGLYQLHKLSIVLI